MSESPRSTCGGVTLGIHLTGAYVIAVSLICGTICIDIKIFTFCRMLFHTFSTVTLMEHFTRSDLCVPVV